MLTPIPPIRFVNRAEELAFLNGILRSRKMQAGNLILLYGRRRVGKSALLRHWAEHSGLAHTYWTAEKAPAALQRRHLAAKLFPGEPTYDSWSALWRDAARMLKLAGQPHILILDELPYAIEADTSMLSSLQTAWDQDLQHTPTTIALCGSHVRTMEMLTSYQSPLFGRMNGRWHLAPLPFGALRQFFPQWSAEERVALYAVVGGIAAYLTWLDPDASLSDNIKQVILNPGGAFVSEPAFLLYDEVREPASHLAVLRAIGQGHHTLDDISNATLMGKPHVSAYLARLQELRMVERRLPATVPPGLRHKSRQGRYHLSDAYFRFYFRFIAPHLDTSSFDPDPVLRAVRAGLRAFVGQTAFEELAREWVRRAAREEGSSAGRIGFMPDVIGSHWNRNAQADVVATNFQERRILIGECKWGDDTIDRQVARDLIEHKTPLVLADLPDKGAGWTVTHALFARRGFTPAARAEMKKAGGLLVDLATLERDLAEA